MYNYLPIIVIMAAVAAMVYFLMIRPLRQREKEHDRMVIELDIGDSVITAGGMYGKVERVDEESVVLEVESGAKVRVTKGGILKKE
ncbi:preprotein translocase subunit YajC [Chloroflexota bacterium]